MSLEQLMLDSVEGEPGAWGQVSAGLRDAVSDYARRRSPYYARVAPESGRFEDCPVLTRSALRDSLEEIIVPGLPPERGIRGATSGSTGRPGRYVQDTDLGPVHLSALGTLRRLHGLPPESRLIRVTASADLKLPSLPDWVIVSTYGLTAEGIPAFLEQCAAPGDHFLYIRSSSVAWIAEQIERLEIPIPTPPRAIVTTMDMLTSAERVRTARAFGCPVHSWYGMQEICGFVAGTISGREAYALNPLVTYAEVLDDDDRAVAPGETGRLVLTDLHNRIAPLIRYDTGDAVVASDEHLGGWPVFEGLSGRQGDLLRLADGRTISPMELGFFLVVENDLEPFVAGYQCLQRASGGLELRIVWRDPREMRQHEATAAVRAMVGDQVALTVVSVDELETLPSGKRWIVRSELN